MDEVPPEEHPVHSQKKEHLIFNKKHLTWKKCIGLLLLITLILNCIVIVAFWGDIYGHFLKAQQEKQFSLLNPELSKLTYSEFRSGQKYYTTNYKPLRIIINDSITLLPLQDYSLYFENINTGSWIGIRERETFYAGSLRKIPLLVATLDAVENEELSLDTPITIIPQDINVYSGILYTFGAGRSFSVAQLLNYSTYYSDNTAAQALIRVIGTTKVIDASFHLGLDYSTYLQNKNNRNINTYPISSKEFSNSFRSLYNSNYLRRTNSQFILSLLSSTSFTEGLPAGVPPDISVAHKIAFMFDESQYHDCGIIYYPKSPYILCIMTKGMSKEEANKFIANISKIVYQYIKETT
ncbi:serine hydrolase [Candidatus Woesearchaeota archaeon]|nr:serine hydrolase [Candidatus Woesearchaeota archaeon]